MTLKAGQLPTGCCIPYLHKSLVGSYSNQATLQNTQERVGQSWSSIVALYLIAAITHKCFISCFHYNNSQCNTVPWICMYQFCPGGLQRLWYSNSKNITNPMQHLHPRALVSLCFFMTYHGQSNEKKAKSSMCHMHLYCMCNSEVCQTSKHKNYKPFHSNTQMLQSLHPLTGHIIGSPGQKCMNTITWRRCRHSTHWQTLLLPLLSVTLQAQTSQWRNFRWA